jgi:hypothetical protein
MDWWKSRTLWLLVGDRARVFWSQSWLSAIVLESWCASVCLNVWLTWQISRDITSEMDRTLKSLSWMHFLICNPGMWTIGFAGLTWLNMFSVVLKFSMGRDEQQWCAFWRNESRWLSQQSAKAEDIVTLTKACRNFTSIILKQRSSSGYDIERTKLITGLGAGRSYL